ncbi:TetR/AcrR family transcriptional regulator [Actinoplanes couchii]|uniref:HTH tetR-type domain-containing protein n=1 Tax=Actinoplanes couchii TaxID=403638 RepID=A0ABQ3X260_9ACTN|nr:TetR/AcrR family transcriptional regulator [Actinoplanes couchii]MDR6316995.1 AcrR family transcriptional regulator [Actinoplanes couchii]GID52603.1 hypothetical protein Aco03nite_010070 [Actinoplanes couchii]
MSTREKIAEAARRLAMTDGLGALSVRAVAREAGVGATTLRHYFPAQIDLYHAVATYHVQSLVSDLSITDETLDPQQRLYDCLAQFLPPAEHPRATLESWFELHRLAFAPDATTAIRTSVSSAHQVSWGILHRWLTVLADQGHLPAGRVDDHVGTALVLINGINLTMLTNPDHFDLAAASSRLRWLTRAMVGEGTTTFVGGGS